MKRTLLSLLLAVLLLACIPLLATQVQAASEIDLTFTDNGSGYSVTDCKASASGDLTIPSTYNGKPVTRIGDSAFKGCRSLTEITIPDSVTSVGYSAFEGCSGLTKITIPDSVTSIGNYAFRDCSSLTSIAIPDSVTSIDSLTFRNCSSLTEITIPDGVTRIGWEAFYGCSSLTAITIPDSVTSIGDSAFSGCSSLTAITIPEGVTSVGNSAFYRCSSLTSITIPDSVTSIGKYAFSYCSGLTAITIPDSMTSIGDSAFSYCSGLTAITIPDVVTSIGDSAFYRCSSLTAITIPDGVTSIGDYAFDGCISLTAITIPDSVTSIGKYAFYDCSGLTEITIPDGVTSIGNYSFDGCSSLTAITIPDSVTSIGYSAFRGCSSLTGIWICENNPSYSSDTHGVLLNKNKTQLILAPGGMSGNYAIPDGVTSIGSSAFYGCSGLSEITIPEGVTSIGSSAFYGCSGLTEITIPDGVTSIAAYAFYGCSGLTKITIPDGVTSIAAYAFYGCSSLTAITIPDSVTSIDQYAFSYCSSLTSVTIPDSVTSIGWGAFDGCSGLTAVYITDVAAWCNITFYNRTATPLWYANALYVNGQLVTEVVFPDGVTNIRNYVFYGCSSLTSVTIPDSVTSIGKYAFCYCSSLTEITIPDGVTSIGNYAFYDCSGLTEITIPDSVTSVGYSAFGGCSNLTKITIPDGVTSIGSCAFYGCSSLTEITIPDGVTSIEYCAFYGCSSLEYVYYEGTDSQKEAISISVYNDALTSATWYYVCIGAVAHQYSDNCDTVCNVCGKVREAIHNYTWVIDIDNNCGEDGIQHQECTNCHYIQNADTIIAATGKHTFSDNDDISCNICSFQKLHISFDLNGGLDGPENIWVETSSVQISEKVPTKSGYVFICWQTTGSNPLEYQPGDTVLLTDSISFVAIWVKNCANCNGTNVEKCKNCKGSGKILNPCSICDGKGWNRSSYCVRCSECSGNGTVKTGEARCRSCQGSVSSYYYKCKCGYEYSGRGGAYVPKCCINCGRTLNIWNQNCSICHGYGWYTTYGPCSSCSGNGEIVEYTTKTCGTCSGSGGDYYDCSSCVSGSHICSVCNGAGIQQASTPPAPQSEKHYCQTVVLQELENGEYSLDGLVWQRSPVFENLEPGKEYSFYQRYARTDAALASESSAVLKVTAQDHIFDNACDTSCNTCGTIRTVADHLYGSWEVTNTEHQKICLVCGDTVTEEHNWNSGEVTRQPTCGEAGVCTYTCTICEAARTEEIPATGNHSYSSWTVTSTEHQKICLVCGDTVTGEHNWNSGEVTQQPTCGEAGVHTYTCTICETARTDDIPATDDHIYGMWTEADERTHSHTCTICHKTETQLHCWGNGQLTQSPTGSKPGVMMYSCAICGAEKLEETDTLLGDLDDNGIIDNQDVEYLLWYTLFPEDYPITANADFNGDGMVNNQDVEYLLWHTLFPEDYPLGNR